MLAAYLSAWRRLPEQTQRVMLRDRLRASFVLMPARDLDHVRELLPLNARQPFTDLVAALREWT